MKKANTPEPRATLPMVRCALYTRKSTEEGLEQEFNSLDAQREAGEAFVASQRQEGWTCLPQRYDDGGFTGGNMDRPALQRLLTDIEGALDEPLRLRVTPLLVVGLAEIVERGGDGERAVRNRGDAPSPVEIVK